MAAKNDITGDSIKTKTGNEKAYAEGWERIFGKKDGMKKGDELVLITAGTNVGKSKYHEEQEWTDDINRW